MIAGLQQAYDLAAIDRAQDQHGKQRDLWDRLGVGNKMAHVSGYFHACVKLEGALPQALLYSDL